MVRSTASLVDKLRAEKTRLRYNNEPAMRQLAEKIATLRHFVQPPRSKSTVQSIKELGKILFVDTHSSSGC